MDIATEIDLAGTIAAGRGNAFGQRLAAGSLDEVEFEDAETQLGEEGRDFLLWAACVACAPRLAGPDDRALVARALPGWCLTAPVARRVEGLARSIGIVLNGYTWGRFPEVDALVPLLVDQALACIARRQALCRCA